MQKKSNYFYRKPKISLPRTNHRIKSLDVQVIDSNGENLGVLPIKKAIDIAKQDNLDLIEISPNANPPVCKIIDYKKFLYDQKKKQKIIKANASKTVIKEIRFGPNTEEHDLAFKTKHALKFLEEGSKVKAFVFFRGRSIVFKEKGEILLLKFAQALEDYGVVEQMPKLEGKRMTMFIAPKKKK